MNKATLKLSILAAATAAVIPAMQGAAQDMENHDQILRELKIMTNIFQASMEAETESEKRFWGGQSMDSLYLADQGVVFSFNLRNYQIQISTYDNGRGFVTRDLSRSLYNLSLQVEELNGELQQKLYSAFPNIEFNVEPVEPITVVAPAAPASPALAVRKNWGGIFFNDSSDNVTRQMSEEIREQEEEVRQLQREMREKERELRGNRNDADDVRREMAELEENLRTELGELDTRRIAYEEYLMETENVRREKVTELNTQISDQIIATLCDYGRTLRSLKNDEHVTIVLENFIDDTDQIHVFDFESVESCTSPERLKQSATSYQM